MNTLAATVKKLGTRCLPAIVHRQFAEYLGYVRQAPHPPASRLRFYRRFLSYRRQRRFIPPPASAKDPQLAAARQFDQMLRILRPPALQTDYFYPLDDRLILLHPADCTAIASVAPDYAHVLRLDLDRLPERNSQTPFGQSISIVAQAIRRFSMRAARSLEQHNTARSRQVADYLRRLPSNPPATFDEAIQKILFYNGLLWQNRFLHNGLGRLDLVLAPYYDADLRAGRLTRDQARDMLKALLLQLGAHTRFKSIKLIGDTGQVIMLGGSTPDASSFEHDLTFLFLDLFRELAPPDPKCVLRVHSQTSDRLWLAAVHSIASGCGSPLLANEEVIRPLMQSYGYDPRDTWNLGIGACWEPFVVGRSFDQTNLPPAIFPLLAFSRLLQHLPEKPVPDFPAFLQLFEEELRRMTPPARQTLRFTPAPLLSLLFPDCLDRQRDISEGGARYNFHGRQVVGLPNTINSLLNVKQLVFDAPRFTLQEAAAILAGNFAGREDLRQLLLRSPLQFGSTQPDVVELTRRVMDMLTRITAGHTINGSKIRIGFATSRFVDSASEFPASLDGRKASAPVAAHISPLSPDIDIAEALDFGASLDYSENRLNGNVVDFIVPPAFLADLPAFARILKHGIRNGAFEIQLNVLSHEQLLDARAHPERYPNLIVRVWGFSAYFCDLPAAYQDEFIRRTAPPCPLPSSP